MFKRFQKVTFLASWMNNNNKDKRTEDDVAIEWSKLDEVKKCIVFCDHRILIKLMGGKIYRRAIKQAMLCGTKCCIVYKQRFHKMA